MRTLLITLLMLAMTTALDAQSADVLPVRTSVYVLNSPYTWTATGDPQDTLSVHTFSSRAIILRAVAVVDTGFAGVDSLQYRLSGDAARVLSYVPSALPGDDIVYQEWEGWDASAGDLLQLIIYGISAPVTGQIRIFIMWQEL